MVGPVANGVGGEVDEALPPELERHDEFERGDEQAFEGLGCGYPDAAFGLVGVLHD